MRDRGERSCIHVPLSAAAIASALSVAIALVGCASETGLVITIATGDLQTAPDRLEVFVGVDDRTTFEASEVAYCDIPTSRFLTDNVPSDLSSDRIVDVTGRDLAADPYKLLMRKGQAIEDDDRLMVVVVGWADDAVVGLGVLDTPVAFSEDKVLDWRIDLSRVPATFHRQNDCLCVEAGAMGPVIMVPSKDIDCDDVARPLDCNDQDPTIHPDARELCDGIDNNCVAGDDRFPTTSICLNQSEQEVCLVGVRECNDSDANGAFLGECRPFAGEANIASQTMCNAFFECAPDSEQMDCLYDKVFTEYECKVHVGPDGICEGSAVYLGDNTGSATDVCRWVMARGLQSDGFDAALLSLENGIQYTWVANICRPAFAVLGMDDLVVEQGGAFHIWESRGGKDKQHVRLRVEVEQVGACANDDSTLGFSCEGLMQAPF